MRTGFSLVELSIVLVILGLLTGGILTGQNLIRAAELRSIVTDFQRYQTAANSFRDKYFAIPGDMRNAVKFWGAQAGGTADGFDAACQALGLASPATDARTCNGNGDGMIGAGNLYDNWTEVWRAWQHLANAGLVEGSYTGVTGTALNNGYGVVGQNVPRSKIARVGYAFIWTGNRVGHGIHFDGSYGNVLRLGASNGMDEMYILPGEAWNIDTKIDDGKPGYGRMRSYKNTPRPNCASTDDAATAEYLVNSTSMTTACNLDFMTGI